MGALVGLARSGARAIQEAYEAYRRDFERLTQRARQRFEKREWPAAQRDALERLELYRQAVEAVAHELGATLGERQEDAATWARLKDQYTERTRAFPDVELAETFFNSVTRKVFVTVGIDPAIEYVDLDIRRDRYGHWSTVHRRFERESTTAELVARALEAFRFATPYRDLEGDAALAAAAIEAGWRGAGREGDVQTLDLIESAFYRGSGAYLVGRVRGGRATVPVVLVLVNREEGVEVDAVLSRARDVSVVFSYTRSHFLVEVARPVDTIRFLASIMPRKPLAELYIALGYPKHGKTEMYRDLMGHLGRSMDRFDHAPGQTGMVMIVFTLRSHEYVFKVIRDEFAPPKTNTRQDVMKRYNLVFRHDRAGRMIEAHEFEHLVFEARRFAPELLEELSTGASQAVTVTGGEVHIHHMYIERRVHPLDLFLRDVGGDAADHALRDYGQAIRDLATTNIFPGDLLLKNFGVTRNGRVTFYDYDELVLVTDCEFRDLPTARDDGEELAAEPWFYVAPNDVFPEEFLQFLGLTPHQREVFLAEHAEVLTAAFWRSLQKRHRAGEVLDVLPYPASKRLR